MFDRKNLDKRICDVEEEATNEETYREFIRNSERDFCMEEADIENMSDALLEDYINFLDCLWGK